MTDNQLLLGTIKTGATTFSTVSLASAVSFGDYRIELHKADTSAITVYRMSKVD